MKKVQILMSTYNGEKYLEEQIESIKNQKNIKIDILVRDDGSTDKTIEILKNNNIQYYCGKNLKPALSFIDLVNNADQNYDYYAFADQDDYWLNNKIFEAIKKIENEDENKPVLYFSAKNIVDKDLNFLYKLEEDEKITLESAMIKNIATGCTMVFNKKLLDILQKYNPTFIEMHDAWIYRICLAIGGTVVYDDNSYILYRQHGKNVIGAKESFLNRLIRRFKSFFNSNRYREKMAKEILNGYEKYITEDNYKILYNFANYRNNFKLKLKLIFNKKVKLNNLKDNLIFKIAVILGKV